MTPILQLFLSSLLKLEIQGLLLTKTFTNALGIALLCHVFRKGKALQGDFLNRCYSCNFCIQSINIFILGMFCVVNFNVNLLMKNHTILIMELHTKRLRYKTKPVGKYKKHNYKYYKSLEVLRILLFLSFNSPPIGLQQQFRI